MAKVKRMRWDKHPSVIVVNDKPMLKVFEEYFVEEDLPKFQKILREDAEKSRKSAKGGNELALADPVDANGFGINPTWLEGEGVQPRATDLHAAKEAKWQRNRYVRLRLDGRAGDANSTDRGVGRFRKALRAAKSWFQDKATPSEEGVSVEETFRLVKEDELYVTTEDLLRSRGIATALVDRFRKTCQFAMAKKVEDHLSVLAAKINLAQHDMCRYITEEQAIEFITKAERGVQVEFLRYYPEVIPNDVAAKMAQCNLAMLFDNYVVMYYSKDVKPARLLEEEIDEQERHKRRDPILFGTIRGDRNLYYVADWVYKDDDLTLATVEKAIGTLPTLKDEKIADSQYRIEELMHEATDAIDKAIAQARDTGHFILLPETRPQLPPPPPPPPPPADGNPPDGSPS